MRFLLVGGLSAVANVSVRWAVNRVVSFEAAVVIAFFVALTLAFMLNRRLVFATTGPSVGQFWRFMLVNVLALAQVWGVSVLLFRSVFPASGFYWHAETVAHVIGVCSPLATSYFAHKHFSFAERG